MEYIYKHAPNFNAVARPFPAGQHSGFSHGSGETFPPPPTVFQPSLNKYTEAEEDRPTSTQQSRSFKLLQGLMDSGQDISILPLPRDSKENGDVRKSSLTNDSSVSVDAEKSGVEYDGEGRIMYKPSETYKLIHGESDQADTSAVPLYSKTFKRLQEKLDGAPVASYTPPPPAAPAPPPPPPPPVQMYSLPKQAAHAPRAPPPPPAPVIVPKAPPPPPVHRPPASTKPKVSAGPPKPTGHGATKGKKGDAVYKTPDQSGRIPVCAACGTPIRGPFVLAMGKSWCPAHFVCANPSCGVKLFDIGFVEEGGFLYCEKDYELYFAPHCHKCNQVIIGECVNAMNTTFHPNCFLCAHCRKPIGGSSFHIEDGEFYCDPHWKEMFQAICFGCKYPIDPGDRWVEAMDHSYHSDCFACTTCQLSLEGQPFYAKAGKPYCKKHAR
eukprot:XP_014769272.1 PREDICTED: LIM domain-binding protein 3-like isoform X2 [Octopus bimaculoides]